MFGLYATEKRGTEALRDGALRDELLGLKHPVCAFHPEAGVVWSGSISARRRQAGQLGKVQPATLERWGYVQRADFSGKFGCRGRGLGLTRVVSVSFSVPCCLCLASCVCFFCFCFTVDFSYSFPVSALWVDLSFNFISSIEFALFYKLAAVIL